MTDRKHWLILCFGIWTATIHAQIIVLPAGSLSDALGQIEKNSDWLINFNPDLVASLKLSQSFRFNPDNIEAALSQLLEGQPIDYTISGNVILIIPREEKHLRICGTLRDNDTGEPLEYVNLFVDANQGTWTDANGEFEFNNEIPEGLDIRLSYIGYKEEHISAAAFQSGCRELTMSPEIQDFPMEIIIRDYFLPSITQGDSYSGIHMDMSSLHRDIGAIERDLLKNVQFIPGITSLDETAGNISIRGSKSDQNLILWEDAPIYNSGHLFGMISSINPFVIDDVHIQKGVYSPSYENRIGGILDIRLSEDPASSLHGAIGSTMTEAHGELSIPIITKKLRLQLSGRHSIANLIHDNPTLESYGRKLFRSTELFDEKEEDENLDESDTGINYSDITAKLMYRPNDQFYFSSSFLRTENNFEHAFNFGIEEPAGRDNLYTYSLIWTNLLSYKWNDRSITSLRANLSKYNSLYDFNFNESSGSTSSILRSNANDISDLQIKWTHQFLWKDFDFEGGYTFDFKDLSYSISEESRFEEDLTGGDDQVGNFHHLYLNSRWHHGDWLFEIGGRGTFWDEDQSFIFSPRFNISRSLTPDLNIKFSGGLFNQYIRQLEQFNESSLNLENQLWVLATEDLMTAQKLGIGLIYQKKGWLIDIDTYYQFADRVPVLTSGQSSELEINSMGNLNSIGLELLIKRRWQQWHSALSYHLSEVTFNIPEFIDEQFPGNNDQRHNLTWINYFKYKSWSIGAQYQFRSGLPFTEIDELTYVEEDEEDYYEVKVDGLNDQRLGHYHRLDLYIGFQKLLANQMQFDAQLSLLNIFNFQNTTSRSYVLSESATGSDPEIFEVEKLQLGRTPQVLFRLSF